VDSDLDRLFRLIRGRFSVVQEVHKQFEPVGTTVVFILSESHFTLHTYPEHSYMSLDLYVCNFEVDLSTLAEEVKGLFKVREAKGSVFLRGVSAVGASHARAYSSSYPAIHLDNPSR
jgi:S-adenosylmethionine/arginine decarboxylase-like enzyme